MDNTKDESYERRREQVRRAQKNHRARKATYVKAIEEELAELRRQNAVFRQQNEMNQTIIRRLQQTLISGGLSVPEDCVKPSTPEGLATIAISGGSPKHQSIHARFPSPSAGASLPSISDTESSNTRKEASPAMRTSRTPEGLNGGGLPAAPQTQPVLTSHMGTSIGSGIALNAHPQGLDATQVGVDFVLALEQPCIMHHKMASPELLVRGEIGSGHKAMLSSPIMARSPSFSFNPLHLGYPTGSRWNVPTAELETLLHYSQDLGLDSEVTPIEALQVIKRHPKFSSITFQTLERFQQALFPLVKCFGFGAVIDRTSFEQAVEEIYRSVGSPFNT